MAESCSTVSKWSAKFSPTFKYDFVHSFEAPRHSAAPTDEEEKVQSRLLQLQFMKRK